MLWVLRHKYNWLEEGLILRCFISRQACQYCIFPTNWLIWHTKKKKFILSKMKQLPCEEKTNRLGLFSLQVLKGGTTTVYQLMSTVAKLNTQLLIIPSRLTKRRWRLTNWSEIALNKGKNVPLYTADTEWLQFEAVGGPGSKSYQQAQKRIWSTEPAGQAYKCWC